MFCFPGPSFLQFDDGIQDLEPHPLAFEIALVLMRVRARSGLDVGQVAKLLNQLVGGAPDVAVRCTGGKSVVIYCSKDGLG